MFNSLFPMNLIGISQPGVLRKAESLTLAPHPLQLSVLRAAGQEPWPWARKRAWAGRTHPWRCDAETAGVKLSPEPAWTWPFAELDTPNLSLGAEQAAICRVAPGPRHLARLLIKSKINDPGLVVPLPVLGSG